MRFARRLVAALGLCAALVGCKTDGRPPEHPPTADEKQARLAVEGFLTALTASSLEQAHGFCTPRFKAEFSRISLPSGTKSWTVTELVMSTSGQEASIKAEFASAKGKQTVVAVVAKFTDQGTVRWLVDACSIGPPAD